MSTLHKSEVPLYCYVRIKIPVFSGQIVTSMVQRAFQNQIALPPGQTIPSPIDNRPHEYLNFTAGLPPRRLELDSSFGTVQLPNISPIRDLYNQHGGFSQAIVSADFISPESPSHRVAWWKAQVLSSGISESGAQISLELATPVGLLDGLLLQRSFTESEVPHLVHTLNVSIG